MYVCIFKAETECMRDQLYVWTLRNVCVANCMHRQIPELFDVFRIDTSIWLCIY